MKPPSALAVSAIKTLGFGRLLGVELEDEIPERFVIFHGKSESVLYMAECYLCGGAASTVDHVPPQFSLLDSSKKHHTVTSMRDVQSWGIS